MHGKFAWENFNATMEIEQDLDGPCGNSHNVLKTETQYSMIAVEASGSLLYHFSSALFMDLEDVPLTNACEWSSRSYMSLRWV